MADTATLGRSLPASYDPSSIEERIYQSWMDNGYFHTDPDAGADYFSVVIPPPNVTGILHVGHALNSTFQDILVRWNRMKGLNTLWVPGTDHAGIATQAKVEESLAREGLSKHDLGREAFLDRVWDWKERYGGTILSQLKRLGASCDWERTRFTMDDGCSEAVNEVFIRLFDKGLIYQGNYIVNWCPKCQTAVSDIEVDHEEKEGNLWHIRYDYSDGSGHVVVATTRPETMLGDTAVAVHPGDVRYEGKVGKMLLLPLMNREIPIIADEYVDPSFGTGAVKVTPAHDPNDFAMGQRHALASPVVIGQTGAMTDEAGPYAGLDRYEARKAVLRDLEALGSLVKVDKHLHAVGQCSRCDTVIEPVISKQWFVKMKPLADPALAAVRDGSVQFVPERFTKVYIGWLEEIRDWCISRQLWWGHRIPVYYCQDCGDTTAAKCAPAACRKCGGARFDQDPDVLDTWFSSALWPFSTLGWPRKTEDLAAFFPTSMLVTARDIIFFWVARMIFMGLETMGEVPFPKVVIHGLIMDSDGKKMSKSKGNTVDPMEVMDSYGADTLRFMLITGTAPGVDTRWQVERLEGSKYFCNKIWNASRFAMMNLQDFKPEGDGYPDFADMSLSLPDKWILSKYMGVVSEVDRQLDRCDPGEAARVIYEFVWDNFCDWYIEAAKPSLYGKESPEARLTTQTVLWYVLTHTLQLLHPFMPFITEEIWQHLPHYGETIMLCPWPKADEAMVDAVAESQMVQAMDIIRAIRNQRAEVNVPPSKRIQAVFRTGADRGALLKSLETMFKLLAGLDSSTVVGPDAPAPEKAVCVVSGGVEVFLPLAGLVDADKELVRLAKELDGAKREIGSLSAKLANEGFLAKAPEAVVDKEKAKLVAAEERRDMLLSRMAELRA